MKSFTKRIKPKEYGNNFCSQKVDKYLCSIISTEIRIRIKRLNIQLFFNVMLANLLITRLQMKAI